MHLLAFDTSTRQSSIALCTEDAVLGEYIWNAGSNHSVELLDNMRRLLTDCEVALPQIDAIAVAIGPGSFNGVRVSVSAAKALAFSLQKTLLGVGTLDCIAAQQNYWRGPICALLEAGRGELYAACYRCKEVREDNGNVSFHAERMGEHVLLTPPQLVEHLRASGADASQASSESWLFCGELKAPTRQALQELMGKQGVFAPMQASARRASTLAALSQQRLRMGQHDDPLTLEPLYLRRPSITKSTRKQPLLAGTMPPDNEATQAVQDTTEREKGALRH